MTSSSPHRAAFFQSILFAICLVLLTKEALGAETGLPELIAYSGRFSNYYYADWSRLDVGLQSYTTTALANVRKLPPRSATIKREGNRQVTIENQHLVIKWSRTQPKYKGSAIYIANADEVTLRNLVIENIGVPYGAYDTIFVENAAKVSIQNVEIRGSAQGYHIRVANSRQVFIDGVDIAGTDTHLGRNTGGGGIWIDSPMPSRENEALSDIVVIQNTTVHDYASADKWRNQDAINVTSPTRLLIFNCSISDFGKGGKLADAAMDISFRNGPGYHGLGVIERNVIQNSFVAKTPGAGDATNALVWRNNIFVDSQFAVYNENWTNYLLNNLFVNEHTDAALRIWGIGPHARLHIANNVFVLGAAVRQFLFVAGDPQSGKQNALSFQNNYLMAPRETLMASGPGITEIRSLSDWHTRIASVDDQRVMSVDCRLEESGRRLRLSRECVVPDVSEVDLARQVPLEFWPSRDFWGQASSGERRIGALSRADGLTAALPTSQ